MVRNDELPTDLLRTFIAVIDAGSMLQASESVCVTPSAVSLQIKRLEGVVNTSLFFRDRRKLELTPTGEILERYARDILTLNEEALATIKGSRATGRIRVGMVDDFARTLLAGALRHFRALNPDAQLEVIVAGSGELKDLVAANRLDIALCLALPVENEIIARRRVHWFGEGALIERSVVPLAMLEKPCLFRSQAVAALESAGIAHEIVLETSSISALQAAVTSGLAVTSRTEAFMPGPHTALRLSGLPELPDMGYMLLRSSQAAKSAPSLCGILTASIRDL